MAPLIKSVTLEEFLSFGSEPRTIELQPLNILIGPNAAGKSNFVEVFSLLRAVPRDLPLPIREGGGVRDWMWRGEPRAERARIEVVLGEGCVQPQAGRLRYMLAFGAQGDAFVVLDERLENAEPRPGERKPYFYFGYENGRPMLNVKSGRRELRREDIDPAQSILSQRRDPDTYPEITNLAGLLNRIKIYRDWSFGPNATVRAGCKAGVKTEVLEESFDNLPARLMDLRKHARVKKQLRERLRELSPGFDDLEVVLEGGVLNIELQETSHNTPARRLSDGTLRYLCLLAVLLDPSPPPLVVIEEPELGLHPDMFPALRDLLVDMSARTQLVVTTHSPALVDAFTEMPEAIMVCEKVHGATEVRRLDAEQIREWREFGGLAKLWMSGHLGGTRW